MILVKECRWKILKFTKKTTKIQIKWLILQILNLGLG